MAQAQVQINKRGNPQFELVPGMELPEIPVKEASKAPEKCGLCGSKDIRETNSYYVCGFCGMGHYYDGRRLH